MQPYAAGANGGIVGTVTYDTTRNELDPADAATEAYQPGIPDVHVHLYVPVPCTRRPRTRRNSAGRATRSCRCRCPTRPTPAR